MNRTQALVSLQAYLPEDQEIVTILNLCDLHPVDETSAGWRQWQNQYAPYIKVQKNKKLVIRWKGEEFFARKNDLYAYTNVIQIANMSKKLFLIKDKNCLCFLFWGQDDKLRYRRYFQDKLTLQGTWWTDPPLSLPITDLRTIVKYEKIEGHHQVPLAKKTKGTGWITSWPPSDSFSQEVMNNTTNCQSSIIDKIIKGQI